MLHISPNHRIYMHRKSQIPFLAVPLIVSPTSTTRSGDATLRHHRQSRDSFSAGSASGTWRTDQLLLVIPGAFSAVIRPSFRLVTLTRNPPHSRARATSLERSIVAAVCAGDCDSFHSLIRTPRWLTSISIYIRAHNSRTEDSERWRWRRWRRRRQYRLKRRKRIQRMLCNSGRSVCPSMRAFSGRDLLYTLFILPSLCLSLSSPFASSLRTSPPALLHLVWTTGWQMTACARSTGVCRRAVHGGFVSSDVSSSDDP